MKHSSAASIYQAEAALRITGMQAVNRMTQLATAATYITAMKLSGESARLSHQAALEELQKLISAAELAIKAIKEANKDMGI